MLIQKLKFFQFRNLVDQTIECPSGVVFVIGPNGQGKTNFIEAINLLGTSKSFRTNIARELVSWGKQEASVFADISQKVGEFSLGISIQHKKRQAFLNGQELSSLADFLGRLLCVSFSPTDLALIKGQPQGRRRFIDKHLVDLRPSLITHMLNYQRALKSRNQVLKDGHATVELLSPWELIMAEAGAIIVNARQELIAKLEILAQTMLSRFAPHEELNLRLKSNCLMGDREVSTADIMQRFEQERQREIIYRTSLVGPHRDDVLVLLNGHDARAFASQGQTRSLVLALKLAIIELLESERGDSPVVLLDDVDSELDLKRREALFASVLSDKRQVFITGTELRLDLSTPLNVMQIEAGRILPQ